MQECFRFISISNLGLTMKYIFINRSDFASDILFSTVDFPQNYFANLEKSFHIDLQM